MPIKKMNFNKKRKAQKKAKLKKLKNAIVDQPNQKGVLDITASDIGFKP
jgi:hypothetical protein